MSKHQAVIDESLQLALSSSLSRPSPDEQIEEEAKQAENKRKRSISSLLKGQGASGGGAGGAKGRPTLGGTRKRKEWESHDVYRAIEWVHALRSRD